MIELLATVALYLVIASLFYRLTDRNMKESLMWVVRTNKEKVINELKYKLAGEKYLHKQAKKNYTIELNRRKAYGEAIDYWANECIGLEKRVVTLEEDLTVTDAAYLAEKIENSRQSKLITTLDERNALAEKTKAYQAVRLASIGVNLKRKGELLALSNPKAKNQYDLLKSALTKTSKRRKLAIFRKLAKELGYDLQD